MGFHINQGISIEIRVLLPILQIPKELSGTVIIPYDLSNQKSSAPRGGVWKSFARKPLVSIASLYFSPQGAGNYTHTRLNS
jgi:hypothetical protein